MELGPTAVVGGIVVVAMLAIIVTLLVKRQLAEKYAVLWLIIGLSGLVVVVFPGLLDWLTRSLHVQLPSNLLLGGASLLLVGVTLHLSWELSRAENEIRRLAEDSAINAIEIDKLIRRVDEAELELHKRHVVRDSETSPAVNDENLDHLQ